jgi:hypothetical protein
MLEFGVAGALADASALARALARALAVAAMSPLRAVYDHGPAMLGMWSGVAPADACAALTRVPAAAWASDAAHRAECAALLDRSFVSAAVGAATAASLYVAYRVASLLELRYLVVRPLLHDVRCALREHAATLSELSSADGGSTRDERQRASSRDRRVRRAREQHRDEPALRGGDSREVAAAEAVGGDVCKAQEDKESPKKDR